MHTNGESFFFVFSYLHSHRVSRETKIDNIVDAGK